MIALNQACQLIDNINTLEGDRFESYFEGKGNGDVKLIIQDKYYTIGGSNGKLKTNN